MMDMQHLIEAYNGLRHRIRALEAAAAVSRLRVNKLEHDLEKLHKEVRGQ